MSFSQDVKTEITGKKISQECCVHAACYGIACFGKYFDSHGIVLQTESEAVAAFAKRMYQRCGITGSILEKERPNGSVYEFSVKEESEVQKLLAMFGHTGLETALRINAANFKCPGCYSAFVSSAFLCSGTITDPAKEYNLEFFTSKYNLSRDFEGILAEHEFQPHRTLRKSANVVYIKASEQVEQLLAFMGAGNAAMELMNNRIFKEMRNKTNRLSNCETANLNKTVLASVQVKKAVLYLQAHDALETLPPQLLEAAKKRMEYPDYTLGQLAETFSPAVSKSGLSHRLKRITEIAQKMQEKEKNG